jgi:hypothetical protein
MNKTYLSHYCSECHSKLYIIKVDRCDAEFTAYLECLNSHWWHRHPKLKVYSHDSGASWDIFNFKEVAGGFFIPQEFQIELLSSAFKNCYVGFGKAHRVRIVSNE